MAAPQLELDDDLHVIAAAQHVELSAALSADSDLDLAFHLQLQEALSASLFLLPSSSSSPPPQPSSTSSYSSATSSSALFQSELLDAFVLERRDALLAQTESRRATEEILCRAHDLRVATQISRIPERQWAESGDHFHRPFGQGTSFENNNSDDNEVVGLEFRIYCKGMVSGDSGGVGVAVCDWAENVVFEMRKPATVGKSRVVAEMKAVVEGLTAAVALHLKRVVFCFDHYPVYQYIVGRWTPKQRKIVALVNQVNQLREKFEVSTPSLVPGNDIKFAIKLAREAIVSQLHRPSESTSVKSMNESCAICLEDKEVGQFFAVDICSHRYCFSCMKQHVEVKLLHGMVAKCPHEDCNSELKIESCKIFLTPKLIDMMTLRLKEASIPVTEKVYCPYPKCSFLMTKTEVLEYSRRTLSIDRSGARKCIKCEDFFCIYCKVPWHNNMSCHDYKRRNPYPRTEDAKLKTLANQNLWRQCVKCNHMIELDAGCYHMTCRCGYEFCYTCGAEWKNKKAMCSCPLWNEYNIMDQDYESDEDLYDYDDHDHDTDSDDYY